MITIDHDPSYGHHCYKGTREDFAKVHAREEEVERSFGDPNEIRTGVEVTADLVSSSFTTTTTTATTTTTIIITSSSSSCPIYPAFVFRPEKGKRTLALTSQRWKLVLGRISSIVRSIVASKGSDGGISDGSDGSGGGGGYFLEVADKQRTAVGERGVITLSLSSFAMGAGG
ncbi:hypothetical protein HZH66_003601 [Vespula vulgaris]|uniref:Uncharacterized protein n=1 Tax=Vespula vulgaris TaxID=7454 RepID=A0A834KDR7_VESVU|nr:hypothetical protein HZH66_003601 [Vespula vulgaris]